MVKRYDSWSDFVAVASSIDLRKAEKHSGDHNGFYWYGHKTYSEALAMAHNGDESLVAEATALLDKLESVEDGVPTRQWTASPYGAYPVVPEYLSGYPDCMRVIAPTGDVAPVSIYVSTSFSGGISITDMLKHGTTVLALILKLQQVRPVELFLVAETHGSVDGDYFQVIPVDSKPLSLAHACYALTSAAFIRRLTYCVAEVNGGFNGRSWPQSHVAVGQSGHEKYLEFMRNQIGISTDDMQISTLHMSDPILKDPIAWVNQQIARYSTLSNE